MIDEETLAHARLQYSLQISVLRISAHLDSLRLAAGRHDSSIVMRINARICSIAAVADSRELLVRVFGCARRLIVLQSAPNIRVVVTFGWRQRRLDWRKDSLGICEQLAVALVRLIVDIENLLERARIYSASIDYCALNDFDCGSHWCARQFWPHDNALRVSKSWRASIGLRIVNNHNEPLTRVRRALLVCQTPDHMHGIQYYLNSRYMRHIYVQN